MFFPFPPRTRQPRMSGRGWWFHCRWSWREVIGSGCSGVARSSRPTLTGKGLGTVIPKLIFNSVPEMVERGTVTLKQYEATTVAVGCSTGEGVTKLLGTWDRYLPLAQQHIYKQSGFHLVRFPRPPQCQLCMHHRPQWSLGLFGADWGNAGYGDTM